MTSNGRQSIRRVAIISGLAGTLFGIGVTAVIDGPTPVDIKVIRVPEVHTKKVFENPNPIQVFTPLPESCEDTIDYANQLEIELSQFYRPIEKAKLAIEQELMPAALLGNSQDLNDANIKVDGLISKAGDVIYVSHTTRSNLTNRWAVCKEEMAKAREGDLDYKPADGKSLVILD
jgi:hypothetical protein